VEIALLSAPLLFKKAQQLLFLIDCFNENQVDAIRSLSSERGIAHVLNSSLTKTEIAKLKGHYFWINKLLYVAPVVNKEENVNFLKM
jgi:hypothetical protein